MPKSIYRRVLEYSVKFRWLYRITILLYRGLVMALRPFSGNGKIYGIVTAMERNLGFAKVLGPGDTAIKIGAAPRLYSELFRMARTVGKGGLVVAIEADPSAVEGLRTIAASNRFECDFVFVNKATFSRKGETRLILGGEAGSWNRLERVSGTVEAASASVAVEMDTVDAILAQIGLAPETVSYVSVTVNGAEYETLKGMTNLLDNGRVLCVTAIAGRQGDPHLGNIDGRADHAVISEYLSDHGFDVRFRRFRRGGFGYIVGTRGSKAPFL